MKNFFIIVGVVILLVIIYSLTQIYTMKNHRTDDDGKLYVASEFKGQLVNGDGTPATDIAVQRIVKWRGTETVHDAITNSEGKFIFPEIIENSFWVKLMSFLPGETVILVDLKTEIDGETVELVLIDKRSMKNNSELGDTSRDEQGNFTFKPHSVDLICDISKEPSGDNKLEFWGVCEERVPGPKSKISQE